MDIKYSKVHANSFLNIGLARLDVGLTQLESSLNLSANQPTRSDPSWALKDLARV